MFSFFKRLLGGGSTSPQPPRSGEPRRSTHRGLRPRSPLPAIRSPGDEAVLLGNIVSAGTVQYG